MAPPSTIPRRRIVSPLLDELEQLLQARGTLPEEEACRLLLRTDRIVEGLAPRLLESALQGDDRFCVREDGSLLLTASQAPSASLGDLCFSALDLETTGGSAVTDRILEVGAVRIEKGRLAAEFSTLVDPASSIPSFISEITGITDAMVVAAPPFSEVAEPLLQFLGDSVLVAHNLPFDLSFLNRELTRCRGFVMAGPCLCTLRLARRLLAHLPDRRLDTLADYYRIDIPNRHRALDDARATARILLHLFEELDTRGIRTWADVQAFLVGSVSNEADQ